MSTYDEWKEGACSREGTPCRQCHMALSVGKVVRNEIDASSGQTHLHRLLHHSDQLESALVIHIERAGGTACGLEVDVENVGSSHKVPTGLPTREVVLTVEVTVGERPLSRERRFRKVVADSRFRRLEADHAVLLYGAKVVNDNRIAPREKRRERFTFDVRSSGGARGHAVPTCVYRPMILQRQKMSIELDEAERIVY